MPKFNVREARYLSHRLATIYDVVRFVDPDDCTVLEPHADGTLTMGEHCFKYWGRSHRCRYCSSFYARQIHHNQEKDEVRGGRICHVLSAPVELHLGDGSQCACVMELITSKERTMESRAFRNREVLQALSSVSRSLVGAGVICYNRAEECVYANLEAFRLFQVPPGELPVLQHFFSHWLDESPLETGKKTWTQTFYMGSQRVHYELSYHKLFDGEGTFTGYYYAIHDHSLQGTVTREDHFHWSRDLLTNLYDQEGFYHAVRDELNYGLREEGCILCSNIKDFKFVNDLFGIDKGNEILLKTARIFTELAGSHGLVARLHGDRFAIFMEKSQLNEGEFLARMGEISALIPGGPYTLCTHVGIYEITDTKLRVSVMCDRANLALATIKDVSLNRLARYSDELLRRTLHEKELLGRALTAIQNHEFEIYLQPQVTAQGILIGAEALVRWNYPGKGLLNPGSFVPILENAGLISQLDKFVWEETAALLQKWQASEMSKLCLSVNISARDIFYLDVYETFMQLIQKYGLAAEKLRLEITETTLMSDLNKYNALISRLQKEGFQVEIDDFGSGYSSLSTLKDIEANILKIDMGFLRKTKNSERSTVILHSIIAMAKRLRMLSIAEGVETWEQVHFLRKIGCDMFQGYYFAKPMPVTSFEARYFSEVKAQASSEVQKGEDL